jgi:hypothetical protein
MFIGQKVRPTPDRERKFGGLVWLQIYRKVLKGLGWII